MSTDEHYLKRAWYRSQICKWITQSSREEFAQIGIMYQAISRAINTAVQRTESRTGLDETLA